MNLFNSFLLFILAGIMIIVMGLTLIGLKLPIMDYRILTIIMVVCGFIMCTAGRMGHVIANHPFGLSAILGSVLGIIELLIGILSLLRVKIPLIASSKQAFIVVLVIIVVKVIIMQIYTIVAK